MFHRAEVMHEAPFMASGAVIKHTLKYFFKTLMTF